MRGPPPQSSTLFHRLQLRPTAVQTLTFLSAINLLGMKARCSLCPRHAKNPRETRSSLSEAASDSELCYASKCARKKATRQSALASSYDEPFCRQVLQCYAHTLARPLCSVTQSALLSCEKISATGLTSTLCPCYNVAKEFGTRKTLRKPVC